VRSRERGEGDAADFFRCFQFVDAMVDILHGLGCFGKERAPGSWGACLQLGGDSQLLSDTVCVVTFRNDFKYEIQRGGFASS
jgi:hypothetical protein